MLTIKDLKDMLDGIPDDTPIVLQKDDEGNGYRYARGIEFEPENYFDPAEQECYRKDEAEDYELDLSQLIRVSVVY